jgi:hypothetical protein
MPLCAALTEVEKGTVIEKRTEEHHSVINPLKGDWNSLYLAGEWV